MTFPPQGSDEHEAGARPEPGAPGTGPDRFPTVPAPQPYGQGPPYPSPQYGAPQYGAPQYGPPQYGAPQYGAPQYGPPQYGPPAYPAPQYGAPPFGPPAGAPATKSKVGLIVALTAVAVALIAAGVVLVMSLQSTVLDPAAVERDVAAQFEQLEGVAIDLSCPEEMTIESGAEYSCTGTTAAGEEIELAIQIGDELNGDYTWTEV